MIISGAGIKAGRDKVPRKHSYRGLILAELVLVPFLCQAVSGALSGSELLSRLQAFDKTFQSGFTATGADIEESSEDPYTNMVRPAAERTLTLVMTDGHCVLQTKHVDMPESAYRSVAYTAEEMAEGKKRTAVSVASWTIWGPEYAANGDLTRSFILEGDEVKVFAENRLAYVVPPDDISFDWGLVRFLWSMGRGFSKYIHEVTNVVELEDGTIRCLASGTDSGLDPGCWELVVDPAAGYLVRSAKYYESDHPDPNVSALFITNSGTLSMNGCIVAQSSEWSDNSPTSRPKSFTVHTITTEPDYELLEATEKLVFGPYEGSTQVYDERMTPPFSRLFEAGEVYSLLDTVDFDPLEGLADNKGALPRGGGESGEKGKAESEKAGTGEQPGTEEPAITKRVSNIDDNTNDASGRILSKGQFMAICIMAIAVLAAVMYWKFFVRT